MEVYQSTVTAAELEAALKNEGVGYENGIKAEYDRFWDSFQNYGKRVDYDYGFRGWTTECFKPKYDIKPERACRNMLSGTFGGQWTYNAMNLVTRLEECGVVLDFSLATNVDYALNACGISHIGVCDFRNATSYAYVFGSASRMVSIEKIIMPTNQSSGSLHWFGYCEALEHLTIEGAIKLNGMNLSASTKLTHDSIMSVINALETKTSGTWTVTFGATNLAKLTAAEKAIATGKGWTLA